MEEVVADHGLRLLHQLDSILDSHPSIDELGFVHPMQLTSLHALEDFSPDNQGPFFTRMKRRGKAQEASINSNEQAEDCSRRIEGQEVESELPGYNSDDDSGEVEHGNGKLLYDEAVFWCAHGKLAIAVPALAPLYKTAKAEFRVLQKQYAKVTEERCESASCCNGKEMDGRINRIKSCLGLMKEERKASLEKELMKYTRALVIVNCDFATAWNARKRILSSMAVCEDTLLAELQLASMVLSYGPKSEESWAHRRWVINHMISGGVQQTTIDSVLKADSKLVELIAGRSTMNYRAWRHRHWLISQMSLSQVSAELEETKLWAQSHIADNCCFHYRRCLLLGILQGGASSFSESMKFPHSVHPSLSAALAKKPQIAAHLWMEELSWNEELIKHYLGHEALWIHRRFLLWGFGHNSKIFWSSSATTVAESVVTVSFERQEESLERVMQLAAKELQFADSCIAACGPDVMEDANRQCEFAASYKLWLLSLPGEKGEICKAVEPNLISIQNLLKEVIPHRQRLWDGLVPNIL
ncbi:unnamed protein product [Sphagnum troendelagicum]